MSRGKLILATAGLTALAAAGGYWMGQKGSAGGTPSAPAERKPLYYRNPMGLPDTSPIPKKDNMGMDYLPVYAGEETPAAGGRTLDIGPEKIQKLGVRVETAGLRSLDRVVRTTGRIEPDERRIHAVAPKFEGWIERLQVNTTGQPVKKGDILFEVYSPELLSAQREYTIAAQGAARLGQASEDARAGMQQLADSALLRLQNWDVPPAQIAALAKQGEARRTLSFRSPVSGVVTEKKAIQGMRFMPGDTLYQVTDLSSVWVVADIFEKDIATLRPGLKAQVRVEAYPGQLFEGRVAYIYPTLKAETRTVPVRIELDNPGGRLKPAMFAQVDIPAEEKAPVLAVPSSAVIDSGTRQVVLVQVSEGRFEPRDVRLGERGETHVAILEGIRDGERVVVSANFLIDSESNLRAALGGLAPGAGTAVKETKAVGHTALGQVESIDRKGGTITISHQPIASLKWPAMTMDFILANPSLANGIAPGTQVSMEIVERKPGEWVITRLAPKGK